MRLINRIASLSLGFRGETRVFLIIFVYIVVFVDFCICVYCILSIDAYVCVVRLSCGMWVRFPIRGMDCCRIPNYRMGEFGGSGVLRFHAKSDVVIAVLSNNKQS